jgi:hypothetical protein
MKDPSFDTTSTTATPLPSWFGPRASTDDPAVAALLDQVAPARTWQDIGGDFNLNIRLDGAATLVLRVHRPWATRGRVAVSARARADRACNGHDVRERRLDGYGSAWCNCL